jgi:hypothetical protein
MATYIRAVRNNFPKTVYLRVPGFDPLNPLFIGSGVTVDLLSIMTADTLAAMQPYLASLVAAGELIITETIDSAALYIPGPDVSSAIDLLDVTSNISGTLLTPITTGMYHISFYIPAIVSGTAGDTGPTLIIYWVDETGLTKHYSMPSLESNVTQSDNHGELSVWAVAPNPITYVLEGGSFVHTLAYDVHFVVEQL